MAEGPRQKEEKALSGLPVRARISMAIIMTMATGSTQQSAALSLTAPPKRMPVDMHTPREACGGAKKDGVSGAPASIPRIPTVWDSPSPENKAAYGLDDSPPSARSPSPLSPLPPPLPSSLSRAMRPDAQRPWAC